MMNKKKKRHTFFSALLKQAGVSDNDKKKKYEKIYEHLILASAVTGVTNMRKLKSITINLIGCLPNEPTSDGT